MRFILQGVNGVGLVGVDDNFGAYHSVVAAGLAPQSITFAPISTAGVHFVSTKTRAGRRWKELCRDQHLGLDCLQGLADYALVASVVVVL
jgi:hypothetical protein